MTCPVGGPARLEQVPTSLAGARVVLAADAASALGEVRRLVHGDGTTFTVPRVAAFEVAPGGEQVLVRLLPGADPDLVAGWLFGSVAALVLAHQGRFALHASSVLLGRSCVALTGASGAGKSTTTLRLRQRGHALVADDVCPTRLVDGAALVEPIGRPVHVWPETAETLGIGLLDAQPVWQGAVKLRLPAPPSSPTPLRAVVLLERGPVPSPTLQRLRGADAVAALAANAYGHHLVVPRWTSGLLAWASALATTVEVHRCVRPADRWSVDEVADLLLERLAVRS